MLCLAVAALRALPLMQRLTIQVFSLDPEAGATFVALDRALRSVSISLVSLESFSTLVSKSSMRVSVVTSEFTVMASGLDLGIETGARGGLLAGDCI